jgi:hypothetical protein
VLFKKIHSKLETGQIRALLKAAARVAIRPHIACYLQCRPFFQGKSGLEIGGPSSIFALGGPIPIYPIAARVDNCTFSQQTIWEGSVTEGANFHFDNRRAPGHQYIIEACDLGRIPSSSYDFVISSHVLELQILYGRWGNGLAFSRATGCLCWLSRIKTVPSIIVDR